MIITTNRMQAYENHSLWMPKILSTAILIHFTRFTRFDRFTRFTRSGRLDAQDTINPSFSYQQPLEINAFP